MHDMRVYFIFLPLAPSIYWASNRDSISYYAEYVEFVLNKDSSSEDRSDSGFETCTIPQGDDGFFLEFLIKFYSGNEAIFWVFLKLWMSLLNAHSFYHFLLT